MQCDRDGATLVDAKEFGEAEGDPLVGTTIANRYKIVRRIGIGGMGTVYEATQVGLNRPVALKILKQELSWNRDTVTRFHREAKAMSLLVHPNTVRVFDFGETGSGLLYLAMEHLEGELLTGKLKREGMLDVQEAVRIAQPILRSLHEAHSKGIIHRDLKPDNVFLSRVGGQLESLVKVLDFGIAKVVQGDRKIDQLETQAGTVFGTPRYMSPEQAQGKPLDSRSDLYSVGILLYQLLCGRPPFDDEDAVVVMAKHIRERPLSPRRIVPERPIPGSLERVVLKALAKDPTKRFQTAAEFAERLEQCLPDIVREAAAQPRHRGVLSIVDLVREAPVFHVAVSGSMLAASLGVSLYMLANPVEATVVHNQKLLPFNSENAVNEEVPSKPNAILLSEPAGSEVWYRGNQLGHTPLRVKLPQGTRMHVEVRHEGFDRAEADLVGDGRVRTVLLHSEDTFALGKNGSTARNRNQPTTRQKNALSASRAVAEPRAVTSSPPPSSIQLPPPSASHPPSHATQPEPRENSRPAPGPGEPYERFE